MITLEHRIIHDDLLFKFMFVISAATLKLSFSTRRLGRLERFNLRTSSSRGSAQRHFHRSASPKRLISSAAVSKHGNAASKERIERLMMRNYKIVIDRWRFIKNLCQNEIFSVLSDASDKRKMYLPRPLPR